LEERFREKSGFSSQSRTCATGVVVYTGIPAVLPREIRIDAREHGFNIRVPEFFELKMNEN
jgi:hypothetical protein